MSTVLVFGLARAHAEITAWTATRLLLTGVVVASGWTAIVLLLLALAPDAQIRGMMFWLIGDLSSSRQGGLALAVLVVATLAALAIGRDLNVLLRGHDVATSLGVHVRRSTFVLYALSALATAVAVTTAGTIGFVGLVVPHALRLILGNDQRVLLPATALAGGALLVVADTVARSIAAPLQLPAGVLTACLGVPLFLWLLLRR
jgi:iron complex transport system permease protein